MATSALLLMSMLTNHNVMTSMFDLEYLKKQEKNRLLMFKKEQRALNNSQVMQYKALMLSSKTKHMHNSNNSKYYLNYNINKEQKR